MPDSNTLTLDKAVNLRQLKMAHDAAVHFGETTDPTDHDFIDEYQRVLTALYQALEDAQQVTEPALEAAGQVDAARGPYDTLEARFDAVEVKAGNIGFTINKNPMSLL